MVEPMSREVSPCEIDVCDVCAGMEDLEKQSALMHEKTNDLWPFVLRTHLTFRDVGSNGVHKLITEAIALATC